MEHIDANETNNLAKSCPFCRYLIEKNTIKESESAFAVYDKFPVNEGHVLVIPKRHISDYFNLTSKEQMACWQLVNEVKERIDNENSPDGYNVGLNNGKVAGQTIFHVHIHIIPRYRDDVINPQGGIRGVIPERKEY